MIESTIVAGRMKTLIAPAIFCCSVLICRAEAILYDSKPDHPWDRLHRALFLRSTPDGKEFGQDELDPLLWPKSTHLLAGPSHEKAVHALDDFLTARSEKLMEDPWKRAILQHDLWAVFDWAADPTEDHQPERRDL